MTRKDYVEATLFAAVLFFGLPLVIVASVLLAQ